jgi:hypothetical protein
MDVSERHTYGTGDVFVLKLEIPWYSCNQTEMSIVISVFATPNQLPAVFMICG